MLTKGIWSSGGLNEPGQGHGAAANRSGMMDNDSCCIGSRSEAQVLEYWLGGVSLIELDEDSLWSRMSIESDVNVSERGQRREACFFSCGELSVGVVEYSTLATWGWA
jgi:hypothetical protein